MKFHLNQIAIALLIGVLAVLLVGSLLLSASSYWQIYRLGGWRDQVYASEGAVASEQALDDFHGGHLGLSEPSGSKRG